MQAQRGVIRNRPVVGFASSNAEWNDGFAWACEVSASWIRSSESTMPSYWAGLTDRPLFYSRDVCHQLLGAHLLGLDEENLAMMRHFAASATPERGWFPLWSFDFAGGIGAIDYRGDDDFVRETPVVFELVEKAVEQYLWTADERWIADPDLARFQRTTLTEFTHANRRLGTGFVGAAGSGDIFQGLASYNEAHDREHPQLAADGIAAQWAALRAVASTANFRTDLPVDRDFAAAAGHTADELQEAFERSWWNENLHRYASGRRGDRYDVELAWEASTLPAVKGLLASGTRAAAHLRFLDRGLRATPPSNIEAATYYPEAFFAYHDDHAARFWISYLINSRADYPEVPFTLITHLTTGLTGLRPTGEDAIETDSHLADGERIQLTGVRIGSRVIDLEVNGRHEMRLTLDRDSAPLHWLARLGNSIQRTTVEPGETSVLTARP